jgi:hypothetical protein
MNSGKKWKMQARQTDEDTIMRTYEIATPRLALGTAAVALSAIAMAVLVIIPATMDAEASDAGVPAVALAATGADVTRHPVQDRRADSACADAETETVGGAQGDAQH